MRLFNQSLFGPVTGKIIATLGPTGTDSERASKAYQSRLGLAQADRYPTYTSGFVSFDSALSDCLVIASAAPEANEYVFSKPYRSTIEITDAFLSRTLDMVLVKRKGVKVIRSVAIHPATAPLLRETNYELFSSTSKSQAVIDCLNKKADAALTSISCFDSAKCDLVENFGSYNMSWAVFQRKLTK